MTIGAKGFTGWCTVELPSCGRFGQLTLTGSGNVKPVSRWKAGLSLALALALVACADAATGPKQAPATASASVSVATPSDAQLVARGFALALRDVSIRRELHGAWRKSRVADHKLVLQDVVSTPMGTRLVNAAAAGLNVSASSLRSSIAGLPPLDFYVPFKAHRLTWKPTSDVYVATTFDPDVPTLTAYGSDGKTVTLERDKVPAVPFVILHPAEHKGLRDQPQADTPGEVIEDADDGDIATSFEPAAPTRSSSIRSSPVQPSFLIDCGTTCGGGGGGGGTTTIAPGTYINHFNIQASDGWFGESSEMRFISAALVNFQGFVGQMGQFIVTDGNCPMGTYSQDGVSQYVGYYGLFSISPGNKANQYLYCSVNGIDRLAVYAIHIVENDGGLYFSGDDYGWRMYGPGNYPFGAMYNTVERYYAATYSMGDLTAYLRIEIH